MRCAVNKRIQQHGVQAVPLATNTCMKRSEAVLLLLDDSVLNCIGQLSSDIITSLRCIRFKIL
jgi:hypothetical protein